MRQRKPAAHLSNSIVRDRYRKKLEDLLSETQTPDLIQAVWDIRHFQSGRSNSTGFFYNVHQDFLAAKLPSKHYLYEWRLETLVNLKILIPYKAREKNPRTLDMQNFGSFMMLYDVLHKLENASDGVSLKTKNVLVEMYRLTRRQFEWQRGHITAVRLYRYSRIYVTPTSKAFFLNKYGIEFETFSKFCFALFAALSNNKSVSKRFDFVPIGITDEQRDKAWSIVILNLSDAHQLATKIRKGFGHVGYAPSILRDRPCLEIGGWITSPLIELVFNRATETLFYDFVSDGGLREEFGRNFENYIEEILKNRADGFVILRELKYGNPQRATPDLFVKDANGVKVAMELKSRKLPAIARFGEDPVADAEDAFSEIAKGICQLWKYIEDSISGDVPIDVRANDMTFLALVCLDEWLGMSDPVDELVKRRAHTIADEKGISQHASVRRYVQFCAADDLEYVLERGDVKDFVNVIEQSSLQKYKGWGISSIRDDVLGKGKRGDEVGSRTREKIGEILNWWNESFTNAKI